jgi:hypothetical protein
MDWISTATHSYMASSVNIRTLFVEDFLSLTIVTTGTSRPRRWAAPRSFRSSVATSVCTIQLSQVKTAWPFGKRLLALGSGA